MKSGFSHLHTHSSHSVRDSIARPDDLFQSAYDDGQTALAITDHGNLSGLYVSYKSAEAHGVSLIAGLEAYMAIEDEEPNARIRRVTVPKVGDGDDSAAESKYHHLTLLAASEVGLSNLMRLSSSAHEGDAFWSKPRMDLSLLAQHSDGIIVLSGCLGGALKGALASGDRPRAERVAGAMIDIVGRDNYFIEVMSHGIEIEDALNADLIEIAQKFGLGVVATNDAHFVHAADSVVHDAWLCGGSGKTLDDPTRWKFHGSGYHLRSAREMRALFDDEPGFESACDNTLLIAERATGYEMFPHHGLRIPKFDPDNELTADRLLYQRVRDGAKGRYGEPLPSEVKERLRYELDIIAGAGLADYFLIVADMIDWARSQGIRVGPGRGSAAGSCVSYCMGIISVDPLAHGLLFERFLNPTRHKMPDIDTDFEQGRRQEVVNYLIERWGKDSVALIGTLGYSLSKNSLRVAGKVLGAPGRGVALSDTVPTLGDGKTPSIEQLLDESFAPGSTFRTVAERDDTTQLLEVARGFEGVVNTESIHPCGVVIGDEEIVGQIPLRADRRTDSSGGWVSEFDGGALESLGYLKMDVLGLLTLDIIEATVREIKRRSGIDINLDSLAENNQSAQNAWGLIGTGRTDGLFQIEGAGMQELCRRLRPQSVDELAVLIALYRPGPLGIGMHDMYANRKAGVEEVSYDIFTLDADEVAVIRSVMDETLAVLVYQEQLLRIAELVAGFNPPERDNLLRAIGKKDREAMDRSGDLFVEWAQKDVTMAGEGKLAFSQRTARNLWDAMKSSGEYSFNKSHSVGYAQLSFVTAWLKANYPAEFAAGWLGLADSSSKRLSFLSNAREDGVSLCPPDINQSEVAPSVGDDGAVLLGLGKIRDVGTVAALIVEERRANGPYKSLADLASRVRVTNGTRRISITTLRALVESGAFDAFGPRRGMFESLEKLRKDPKAVAESVEWGVLERTTRERQRLGISVSESPLRYFASQIKEWRSPHGPLIAPVPLHHLPDGGQVSTIGVVTSWEVKKRKTRFATMTLEGTKSTIDCVIWNSTLDALESRQRVPNVGDIVGVDAVVKMKEYGEGDEAIVVKELTINDIWSHPLKEGERDTTQSNVAPSDDHEPEEPVVDSAEEDEKSSTSPVADDVGHDDDRTQARFGSTQRGRVSSMVLIKHVEPELPGFLGETAH